MTWHPILCFITNYYCYGLFNNYENFFGGIGGSKKDYFGQLIGKLVAPQPPHVDIENVTSKAGLCKKCFGSGQMFG